MHGSSSARSRIRRPGAPRRAVPHHAPSAAPRPCALHLTSWLHIQRKTAGSLARRWAPKVGCAATLQWHAPFRCRPPGPRAHHVATVWTDLDSLIILSCRVALPAGLLSTHRSHHLAPPSEVVLSDYSVLYRDFNRGPDSQLVARLVNIEMRQPNTHDCLQTKVRP
ncbi:hypothetical protein GGR56DRAFT_37613 [Xylariaceae sp. FL0804]|nr:hypothetical protein GGR56DRAFT_37613 [Xylariaceae sp. FL0804]